MEKEKVIIYTDGGARGNPGPAAFGVVIQGPFGKKAYAEKLGRKTNNEAEYEAVIFALKKTKSLLGGEKAKKTEIELRSDSELLVRQLTHRYKVLEENIQPLFLKVWNAVLDFQNVIFRHVPRSENREADRLLNQLLDREERSLGI